MTQSKHSPNQQEPPSHIKQLNDQEKCEWLFWHIPYRVRCFLAKQTSPSCDYACQCQIDAIGEGRRVAIRWLVEFIGISGTDPAKPTRPQQHPGDIRINSYGSKEDDLFFDPETRPDALTLSLAWKGSTVATAHSTRGASKTTPALLVHQGEQKDAFDIIINYLNNKLYIKATHGEQMSILAVAKNPKLWGVPAFESKQKFISETFQDLLDKHGIVITR